jgi:serine/threonine protein kinase
VETVLNQVVGRFRIERLLGEGGMGSVYLGQRAGDFEQRAAIKLLREGLHDPATRQRFRAEQQALAALQHPNIVQLIDGGITADGIPYLAMDYVEGAPLDEYCRREDLPLRRRIELMIAMLDAVEYAHRRLIAHCDLKFSNILVTADGQPKLLDFGVTKLLEPSRFGLDGEATKAALRPFTPEFASPEQLDGKNLTTATDIYSAGVILYILLAGRHPFESLRDQPLELMRATLSTEPPPPAELEPDLRAILSKALRKEPERRYAAAAHFAADLRNFLEGRPVEARQGSRRYRAWKFVQRNRVAVIGAGILMAAVLAGAAGVLWQGIRAQRSSRVAADRFHDSLRLTSSLFTEFYDAVEKLDGSESARQSLLDWSRETLDRLSQQSASDLTLRTDVAESYLKLGQLEAANCCRRPDQAADALACFDRGLALVEPVVGNRTAQQMAQRLLQARSTFVKQHPL